MDSLRFTDMQIDILLTLSQRDYSFLNDALDENLRRSGLQIKEQNCQTFEIALRKVMNSLDEEMCYAKQEGNVERQTSIQQRYEAVEEYKRNFYSKASPTQNPVSLSPISVPVPAVKQHTQEDRFNQALNLLLSKTSAEQTKQQIRERLNGVKETRGIDAAIIFANNWLNRIALNQQKLVK